MLEVNIECGTIEDIKRRAYEQGVNDAFDAVHKINDHPNTGGYTIEELNKLFPDHEGIGSLFSRIEKVYTPIGVIKTIRDYEKEKEESKTKGKEDEDMYIDPDSIPNEDEYIDEDESEEEEELDGMQDGETSAQNFDSNVINENEFPEVTMYRGNVD